MARKNLGRPPQDDVDTVDMATLDAAVETRYAKPMGGIPASDLAEDSVTMDKIAADGLASQFTWLRGDGHWGVLIGNSVLLEPQDDYTLEPPSLPVDGELLMYEVRPPTQAVTITVPPSIKLTVGAIDSIDVPADTSTMIGIRWSDRAQAWYLIAVAQEAM